ncbi:transcriptional regulator, HxlR family [Devosia sp. YR412]|uniref:winged helix-turn-helix transcriptional regulator n=1 Tax=Devosia sp. YR412 TaxID=1881030 RepID=UPI0008AB7365|nr:helix-turn-helix domain-containing protein [Devosia sp. YR412]SEQ01183.1 transcriptional regulator, HxlR family [Devosia sp. YR412]
MNKHIFKDVATHLPEHCQPTADILSQFGGKWPLAVFGTLNGGPKRFSELAEEIRGISQRMLTLTLRTMERDGMVIRRVTPVVPPRVDYELTERARSLQGPLTALHHWANAEAEGIAESRREFDARGE